MSKKIQEKKTKKPDPKAAGERALNQRKIAMEEEALRIRRIVSKMLEPEQARIRKLELHGTANVDSWIDQITDRLAALESQEAPAEEWTPKVGELAVYDGMCGKVEAHDVNVGEWWHIFGRWVPTRKLSEPTEAEIASHKAKEEQRAKEAEWAKYDVLQSGDACDTHAGEQAELFKLFGKPCTPGGGTRTWYYRTGVCEYLCTLSLAPGEEEGSDVKAWLPFSEFLRRLQGTIAKRAEDERAKEMAKVPEFGTRVKFMEHVKEEQEGLIASELDPSGYIISYRVPDGRWFTIRKKRHEFQIID